MRPPWGFFLRDRRRIVKKVADGFFKLRRQFWFGPLVSSGSDILPGTPPNLIRSTGFSGPDRTKTSMGNSVLRPDSVTNSSAASISDAGSDAMLNPVGVRQQQTSEQLARQIAALGDWFHNINLFGVWTAPTHFLGDFPNLKWKHIATQIPHDLSGATVLDIGCNGGFYSLEMKRRG